MRKAWLVLIVLIISSTALFPSMGLAYNYISLFNSPDSEKAIIENENGALILKQNWYGKKFEVNPEKTVGFKKLNEVNIEEYTKALKEVEFGTKGDLTNNSICKEVYSPVSVNIYFLDKKLRNYSNAAALSFKDNSIVVFGTSYKLGREAIHRLAVHELGHQIDFQLMDDNKRLLYKKIRGIEDLTTYNDSSSVYINRPQEIFAEDFRLLFGGEASRKASHLNSSLQDPTKSAKLKDFFISLIPRAK